MSQATEPLLTIATPTRNRERYLAELLPELTRQCDVVDPQGSTVELLVSDNASTDGTWHVLSRMAADHPRVVVRRHEVNIGGERNFIFCVRQSRGSYVWLFGDDDLLEPHAVSALLSVLRRYAPWLTITMSRLDTSRLFPDYAAAVRRALKEDMIFSLNHTMITSNVFRKEYFDTTVAAQTVRTNYAHMYALMEGLARASGVYVFGRAEALARLRPRRPAFDTPLLNTALKWEGYLLTLAGEIRSRRTAVNTLIFTRIILRLLPVIRPLGGPLKRLYRAVMRGRP